MFNCDRNHCFSMLVSVFICFILVTTKNIENTFKINYFHFLKA